MKKILKYCASILLLTLMFVKVSSLHVYIHEDCDEDAIENCQVCELSFEQTSNDFLLQPIFSLDLPQNFEGNSHSKTEYTNRYVNNYACFRLFSRPPPAFAQV